MRNTIRLLRDPLFVITSNRSEFAIWFIFTIIFGQIGIIVNMIIRYYSYSASIPESIFIDSSKGIFYIFSIALVASLLGPLFINLLNSNKLKFKTLKIFTIIFSIIFLIFAGIVYSVIQTQNGNIINNVTLKIDWTQLIVYLISMFLVFYGYCILRLENNPERFRFLDDPLFNEEDDQNVNEMIEEGQAVIDDGEGVKL